MATVEDFLILNLGINIAQVKKGLAAAFGLMLWSGFYLSLDGGLVPGPDWSWRGWLRRFS
jgi:hypothetical protein